MDGLVGPDESYGSSDTASDVSGPGISIALPDLVSEGAWLRPADAPSTGDGPNMETYHEGPYRCSRVSNLDGHPDARSTRERGPGVSGELLIRV